MLSNIDKYPVCPCYDCLVRSSCIIPLKLSMILSLEKGVPPKVNLEKCSCKNLYDYLSLKTDEEAMAWWRELRHRGLYVGHILNTTE